MEDQQELYFNIQTLSHLCEVISPSTQQPVLGEHDQVVNLNPNLSPSMSGVLHSREANPEQVLQNLGFAGSEVLTRIPDRFLKQQSQVEIKRCQGNVCIFLS